MIFDWTTLIGPGVVAAVISATVTGAGIWISSRTARQTHTEKLRFDAMLARRKAHYDRALKDWERKAAFAENVLAECYQLREVIGNALNLARIYARLDDPTDDPEFDRARQTKEACHVLGKELAPHAEMVAALKAKKYRAQAYFGTIPAEALSSVAAVYGAITLSISLLEAGLGRERNEAVVGLGPLEDQPTMDALGKAISVVEETCRAAMDVDAISDGDGDNDPRASR
ncbi:MAG: hypothetical protein H7Y62_08220 [Hyphomicrobium sp.]|nr:hypothetical protein [Hyphomicrobium sp.]